MDVSLIPDREKTGFSAEAKLKDIFVSNKRAFAALAFFILVSIVYLTSTLWVSNIEDSLEVVDTKQELILSLSQSGDIQKTKLFARRVRAIKSIIDERTVVSAVLTTFEQTIHSGVVLSNLTVDLDTGFLKAEGTSADFEVLGEQFMLWKNSSAFVRNVELTLFEKNNEGRITFNVTIEIASTGE